MGVGGGLGGGSGWGLGRNEFAKTLERGFHVGGIVTTTKRWMGRQMSATVLKPISLCALHGGDGTGRPPPPYPATWSSCVLKLGNFHCQIVGFLSKKDQEGTTIFGKPHVIHDTFRV